VALLLLTRSCVRNRFAPAERSGADIFPESISRPRPVDEPFKGCPPEGDGGDPELNRLKNRLDEGSYVLVPFDTVMRLTWPRQIERKHRDLWASSDSNEIARYEGTPLAIDGYLADAREEGPESPNCHGASQEFRDFHIWLMKSPEDDRSSSIVVEMTPPIRATHPKWRVEEMKRLARDRDRVRISGWLMLDPEHPDQIGKTRGTIWEIHPIMKVEVERNGSWTPLDDLF
jgi:hypothetical protein